MQSIIILISSFCYVFSTGRLTRIAMPKRSNFETTAMNQHSSPFIGERLFSPHEEPSQNRSNDSLALVIGSSNTGRVEEYIFIFILIASLLLTIIRRYT
jgi:hypothetical protein